jgi:hypothetical protein
MIRALRQFRIRHAWRRPGGNGGGDKELGRPESEVVDKHPWTGLA